MKVTKIFVLITAVCCVIADYNPNNVVPKKGSLNDAIMHTFKNLAKVPITVNDAKA